MQVKTNEQIDRWQHTIERAGLFTIIGACSSLAVSGIGLFGLADKISATVILVLGAFLLVLSSYLIWAGRYLRYTPGRATNRVIISSFVVFLLLLKSFIAAIFFVPLFMAYNYRQENKELTNGGRSALRSPWPWGQIAGIAVTYFFFFACIAMAVMVSTQGAY